MEKIATCGIVFQVFQQVHAIDDAEKGMGIMHSLVERRKVHLVNAMRIRNPLAGIVDVGGLSETLQRELFRISI